MEEDVVVLEVGVDVLGDEVEVEAALLLLLLLLSLYCCLW